MKKKASNKRPIEADAAAGGRKQQNDKEESISSPMKKKKKEEKKTTKREHRQQMSSPSNPKNKWPQHPKITSPEARAKAYIRTAGLTHTTKLPSKYDEAEELAAIQFGRLLGGTDQRMRHAAVLKLQEYLRARCGNSGRSNNIADDNAYAATATSQHAGVSEMDLLQLFKALWYTLYMADKAPVQDLLCQEIANMLWCVAGTAEEDEYAGQAYLELFEADFAEHVSAEGDEDDDDDDENYVDGEELLDDDEDEDEAQEISNILEDAEEGLEIADLDGEEEDDEVEEEEEDDEVENAEEGRKERDSDEEEDEDEELNDEGEQYQPHCRGAHLASLFVRTFFKTLHREWGKMDKYRLDKFYTLIRFLMANVYKYMALRHWNLGIVRLFNDAIGEEVLLKTPNGVRFHLIDITLEELAKVSAQAERPLTEATLMDCLEPYFVMAQGVDDPTVQKRVIEQVLERLLLEYSVVSDRAIESRKREANGEGPEEGDELVLTSVHVRTIAEFVFDIASDTDTLDRYREGLYTLHKIYIRRLKEVDYDVPLSEEEENSDEMDDEMDDYVEDGDDDEDQDQDWGNDLDDGNDEEREEYSDDDVNYSEDRQTFFDAAAQADDLEDDDESSDGVDHADLGNLGGRGDTVDPDGEDRFFSSESPVKQKRKGDVKLEKKEKKNSKSLASDIFVQNEQSVKRKQNPVLNKKKRKKENIFPPQEEEIIITTQHQRHAKAKLTVNVASADTNEDAMIKSDHAFKRTRERDDDRIRRVKFGKQNISRSYKLSMRNLREKTLSASGTPPPDKSILLNKNAKIPVARNSKKSKRKKARDYFT